MRTHDVRHTAASPAVQAGANVKTIERMLGHSSAAMTLDVYSDPFDDDLNAVSDALDRAARESLGSLSDIVSLSPAGQPAPSVR